VRIVSIHAPNEGSDSTKPIGSDIAIVSIHAPNEGSDFAYLTIQPNGKVSIHAPNEGSDPIPIPEAVPAMFQSTLPMKGATNMLTVPCADLEVSIHAPNEGSDKDADGAIVEACFNPRSQ